MTLKKIATVKHKGAQTTIEQDLSDGSYLLTTMINNESRTRSTTAERLCEEYYSEKYKHPRVVYLASGLVN